MCKPATSLSLNSNLDMSEVPEAKAYRMIMETAPGGRLGDHRLLTPALTA